MSGSKLYDVSSTNRIRIKLCLYITHTPTRLLSELSFGVWASGQDSHVSSFRNAAARILGSQCNAVKGRNDRAKLIPRNHSWS